MELFSPLRPTLATRPTLLNGHTAIPNFNLELVSANRLCLSMMLPVSPKATGGRGFVYSWYEAEVSLPELVEILTRFAADPEAEIERLFADAIAKTPLAIREGFSFSAANDDAEAPAPRRRAASGTKALSNFIEPNLDDL